MSDEREILAIARTGSKREQAMLDDDTAKQVQEHAVASHLLEARVRRAIVGQLYAQADQVVGAREILDLAEAFAWMTNPGQSHGGR